jgi:hypothetical protein
MKEVSVKRPNGLTDREKLKWYNQHKKDIATDLKIIGLKDVLLKYNIPQQSLAHLFKDLKKTSLPVELKDGDTTQKEFINTLTSMRTCINALKVQLEFYNNVRDEWSKSLVELQRILNK